MLCIDIDMPKSCFDCPCHNGESGYCQITKNYIDDSIPENCPLKAYDEDTSAKPVQHDYLFEFGYDHKSYLAKNKLSFKDALMEAFTYCEGKDEMFTKCLRGYEDSDIKGMVELARHFMSGTCVIEKIFIVSCTIWSG